MRKLHGDLLLLVAGTAMLAAFATPKLIDQASAGTQPIAKQNAAMAIDDSRLRK